MARLFLCIPLIMAALSPANAQSNLRFKTLEACLASEAQAKVDADQADVALHAIYQPLSRAFDDALNERNRLLSILSGIRSACSKLRTAVKAVNGDLRKESLASQTTQLNELHELLSETVLKGSANATVKKIQEQSLGHVRSQMAELSAIMDSSLDTIARPISEPSRAGIPSPRLTGRPDPATSGNDLGAAAAASLAEEVLEWKVKEAATQQKMMRAEAARRTEAARTAAEEHRLAQARYQAEITAGEKQRRNSGSSFGNFLGSLVQGVAGAYVAAHGSGFGGLPQARGGGSGRLDADQCQQLIDQIASDRLALASMSTLTSTEATDVRRLGHEAIASNQRMFSQNCR